MKFVIFTLNYNTIFAQNDNYNTKKGYVAEGYDVVSYFKNKPVEGKKAYTATYDGAKFKFSSQEHLDEFNSNPKKYTPQYGGYCAYAIGKSGEKVSIDPETYEIRDGKLYLFYNSWGVNTLNKWNKLNLFTGFRNIDLSEEGILEAKNCSSYIN